MNYIKHLAGFFDRVADDERLNPTHVSMYVSLFQFWNASRFENPISISRSELMRVSKIASTATYHKCIKELNDFGYFRYMPSYNPFKGSLVYLFDFQSGNEQVLLRRDTNNETSGEQVLTGSHTKNETGTKQALASYINTLNINKQENIVNEKSSEMEGTVNRLANKIKEKSSAQKEKNDPPSVEEVKAYFESMSYPELESDKFFNHFCSNGWLVGGKTPMKDWKAAARNWILNAKQFSKERPSLPQPGQLHATTDKNYAEPL